MRYNNSRKKTGSNKNGTSRSFGFSENRIRGNNKTGFQSNCLSRGSREMHKVICSECKKECEVPFKPTEAKPVYCKECYKKHKPKRF